MTSDFPDVRYKDISAWYELGITDDHKALIIRIEKTALVEVQKLLTMKAPLVRIYEERLNKTPLFGELFIPPREKVWGFGEVLEQFPQERDDWISYHCDLPVILSAEQVKWQGNDSGFYGERNWERAEQVTVTLKVLFEALWLFEEQAAEKEIIKNQVQLLIIEGMRVESGLHGSSFSVKLSKRFCNWLKKQIGDKEYKAFEHLHLPEAERAMTEAHFQIWQKPLDRYDLRRHEVVCHPPKSIHLSCPGNACGLDPEYSRTEDWGYMLQPHNVDSRIQQLTLLAGIAKLHDLVRQEGY